MMKDILNYSTPTKPKGSAQRSGSTEDAGDAAVLDLSNVVQRFSTEGRPKYAVFLRNIFTPEECQSLIERCETKGYEQALLNVGGGRQVVATDVRNNDRCILNDPILADDLFQRILKALEDYPHLKEPLIHWKLHHRYQLQAVSCNELLRSLRYSPGHYFKPHFDGSYSRGMEAGPEREGESSKVTVMLYLNEGFEGGETRLIDERDESNGFDIIPKTGSVLLFQHDVYHEGCDLNKGQKFCIRSDIMYACRKRDDHDEDVPCSGKENIEDIAYALF